MIIISTANGIMLISYDKGIAYNSHFELLLLLLLLLCSDCCARNLRLVSHLGYLVVILHRWHQLFDIQKFLHVLKIN